MNTYVFAYRRLEVINHTFCSNAAEMVPMATHRRNILGESIWELWSTNVSIQLAHLRLIGGLDKGHLSGRGGGP